MEIFYDHHFGPAQEGQGFGRRNPVVNGTACRLEGFQIEIAVVRVDQVLHYRVNDLGVKKSFFAVKKIKGADLPLFDLLNGFFRIQNASRIRIGR